MLSLPSRRSSIRTTFLFFSFFFENEVEEFEAKTNLVEFSPRTFVQVQILSIVSIYHDQYFWSNFLTFFSKKKRKEKERLKDQLEGLERSDGNVDGSLICIHVGESVPILLESST